MTIDTTRHEKFVQDINLHSPVHIIGCGSIGTATATLLCRLGFDTMTLWDPDTVEAHNIANQYFDATDIGLSKVSALKEKLQRINPEGRYTVRNTVFNSVRLQDEDNNDIFIIGVDSMHARRSILYTLNVNLLSGNSTIVDMRMGGELGEAHTYAVQDLPTELFELINDDQTADIPCTERTVLYTVNIVASIGAKLLLQTLRDRQRRACIIALSGPSGPEVLNLILPTNASLAGGE